MSTYLQDTFTDTIGTNLTAHTMNVGGGWTQLNGAWLIGTNNALPPVATANSYDTADAGISDGTLTISLIIPNSTVYATGVIVRASDANTGWLCIVERDGGGTPYLGIFQRTSGTNTSRASTNITGATNTTLTLTAVMLGSTITLSANTGESCSYASATANQTVTKHGVFSYTAGGYAAGTFDDFLVVGVSSSISQIVPTMVLGPEGFSIGDLNTTQIAGAEGVYVG